MPIKEYPHTGGRCSVTGGYVYRGTRRPELTGRYIYGDYCSREIWKLLYVGGVVTEDAPLLVAPSSILSFGTDQFNELHVLCNNGLIYRFNPVQGTVAVVSPNGAEVWPAGSSQTIQWSSSNLSGPVKVELSRNGGGSYETIVGSTPDDGTEEWTVTGPPTASAMVRVSSVNTPSIQDASNGVFTISPTYTLFAKLYIRDSGADGDSLEYGTGVGATEGIDVVYGEYELPPAPPLGAFDVRWQVTGTQGVRRDIRDTLGGSVAQAIYRGQMQEGAGGYPMTLRWNGGDLPGGTFILRDGQGGTTFTVDMKQEDSVVVSDTEIRTFQVIYSVGDGVSSVVEGGWNIVSLPVEVSDGRKTVVFPTSSSSAFAYTSTGYVVEDTLETGVGYWLKFSTTQPVTVLGSAITTDTVEVTAGWNIIGSISSPVSVGSIEQIPGGIVVSQYYGYSSTGYTPATTIDPMKGYWVKVNQNGLLVISAGASARPVQPRAFSKSAP
jgi:hypothetical protein